MSVGTNAFVIKDGLVGISTSIPTYLLDVNGGARFVSSVTASSYYGNGSTLLNIITSTYVIFQNLTDFEERVRVSTAAIVTSTAPIYYIALDTGTLWDRDYGVAYSSNNYLFQHSSSNYLFQHSSGNYTFQHSSANYLFQYASGTYAFQYASGTYLFNYSSGNYAFVHTTGAYAFIHTTEAYKFFWTTNTIPGSNVDFSTVTICFQAVDQSTAAIGVTTAAIAASTGTLWASMSTTTARIDTVAASTGVLTVAGYGVAYSSNNYHFYHTTNVVAEAASAANADSVLIVDEALNATYYPIFVPNISGGQSLKSNSALTYNPGTGTMVVPNSNLNQVTIGSSLTVRGVIYTTSAVVTSSFTQTPQLCLNGVCSGTGGYLIAPASFTMTGGVGGGDNLGNHIATQAIDMAGFALTKLGAFTSTNPFTLNGSSLTVNEKIRVTGNAYFDGPLTSFNHSVTGYISASGSVTGGSFKTTDAPSTHKMYIEGGILATSSITVQGSANVWGTISSTSSATVSTLTVSGNAFSVGGSTLVVNNGKVGIGAVTPTRTLTVNGDFTVTTLSVTFTPGLISHYPMNDNAANTIVVDNVGINTGTAQQNTSVLTTAGKINTALSFNGTGDRIDMGNNFNFERTNAFSISFWIKPFDYTAASGLIGNASAWGTNAGWSTFIAGRYIFFFFHAGGATGSNTIQTRTNQVLSSNDWQLITYTYDGSSSASGVKIYLNNSANLNAVADYNNLSSSTLSSLPTRMGADALLTNYFKGAFDSVRIYNHVLTTNDILAIYNSGVGTELVSTYSSVETLTTSAGRVGIGNTSPTHKLHVSSGVIYNDGTNAEIRTTGFIYTSSGIYAVGSVECADVIDHTPYPETLESAYDELESIERNPLKPDTVNHEKLHPKIMVGGQKVVDFYETSVSSAVVYSTTTLKNETITVFTSVPHYKFVGNIGRNLSETVSALVEVVKDLRKRIAALEKP